MIHRLGKVISHLWSPQRGPYVLLILLFLTVFVISPLLSARIVMPIILKAAFWLIIVAGALNVSSSKSLRLLALAVVLFSIVVQWPSLSFSEKTIPEIDICLSLVMLSIFALLMIQGFLVTGRPWEHRIVAAIAIYLLLGLIWARLYEAVELLAPGAFRVPEGECLNSASLVYFSLVTLATLGYGDFAPVHIAARNLAVLEAITGQLYMVILISRLVSERWAKPVEKQNGEN